MAKRPYLGSTHFRNSAISEFRENNFWRVGYEGQLLDAETQLRGAGRALTSPHFGKWPETPTLGQRILVTPHNRKHNFWRASYDGQLPDAKTQLRGAGRALTSPHFGKWPTTPTLGQHISAKDSYLGPNSVISEKILAC